MGIETRRNQQYYYQKRRIGRRVVSEYRGSGMLAELEAAAARLDRARGRAELAALQQQLADSGALTTFYGLVQTLTSATLAAAGYRQHKRGEWRKPRDNRPAHDE